MLFRGVEMRVLLVLAALLSAVPALAAETMYDNDPNREMKDGLEEAFGIYIINPSRRRPEEKVEIKGDTAEFWLLYDPRKPDFDRIKCDAMRWTLFGRFGESGAQKVFKQYPKINNIDLIVYHLKSTRTADKDGKYTVTKSPQWSIRTRITRKTADRVDWNATKNALDKEPKQDKDVATCITQAQRIVPFKTNREYFK